MSEGYCGFGAILQAADITATSNVTAIANVTRISGPSTRRGIVDISTMDSTAAYGEFKPAMIDMGELTFDLNYEGSTATAKALWLRNQMTHTGYLWTLWINDHTTSASRSKIACNGFLTGCDMGTPMDGKVEQTMTLKFTGQPTHTSHA